MDSAGSGAVPSAEVAGSHTANVDPPRSDGHRRTTPRWASAIWRTMVRPRPLRPSSRALAAVAAPEALEHQTRARSAGMPGPCVRRPPPRPSRRPVPAADADPAEPRGARRTALASRLATTPGAARRGRRAPTARVRGRGSRREPRASAGAAELGDRGVGHDVGDVDRRVLADRCAPVGRRRGGRRRGGDMRSVGTAHHARRSGGARRRSASGSARATSRLVRITASGLRSSCDASWMKRRWPSKASSSRPSMASKVSASSLQLVGRPARARCGARGRWPGSRGPPPVMRPIGREHPAGHRPSRPPRLAGTAAPSAVNEYVRSSSSARSLASCSTARGRCLDGRPCEDDPLAAAASALAARGRARRHRFCSCEPREPGRGRCRRPRGRRARTGTASRER